MGCVSSKSSKLHEACEIGMYYKAESLIRFDGYVIMILENLTKNSKLYQNLEITRNYHNLVPDINVDRCHTTNRTATCNRPVFVGMRG